MAPLECRERWIPGLMLTHHPGMTEEEMPERRRAKFRWLLRGLAVRDAVRIHLRNRQLARMPLAAEEHPPLQVGPLTRQRAKPGGLHAVRQMHDLHLID